MCSKKVFPGSVWCQFQLQILRVTPDSFVIMCKCVISRDMGEPPWVRVGLSGARRRVGDASQLAAMTSALSKLSMPCWTRGM